MEKIDLSTLHTRAAQRAEKHRKALRRLKKGTPQAGDALVHPLHDEVFGEIHCLACANCCKTTSPLFLDKDIERIAAHLKMRPAKFTEQYLRIDEDGDYVLQTSPCPFLGSDNYCAIYDVRPKACREYPHTNRKHVYQIAQLTLRNAAICPAVFEILERLSVKI